LRPSDADLPVTGRCLCGQVRFEISEPFVSAVYCHCTRCQRRSGTAAAASARVVPGALHILAGADLVRCYEPEDGFAKCFCSTCGSALWSQNPSRPGSQAVRLGTIDGDPGIRPDARQFVAYAAVWEPLPDDGLPQYPERRPAQD
jgi:hypothetical protein